MSASEGGQQARREHARRRVRGAGRPPTKFSSGRWLEKFIVKRLHDSDTSPFYGFLLRGRNISKETSHKLVGYLNQRLNELLGEGTPSQQPQRCLRETDESLIKEARGKIPRVGGIGDGQPLETDIICSAGRAPEPRPKVGKKQGFEDCLSHYARLRAEAYRKKLHK